MTKLGIGITDMGPIEWKTAALTRVETKPFTIQYYMPRQDESEAGRAIQRALDEYLRTCRGNRGLMMYGYDYGVGEEPKGDASMGTSYEERVGDLVTNGQVVYEVVGAGQVKAIRWSNGEPVSSKPIHDWAPSLSPLRPTRVGERVRAFFAPGYVGTVVRLGDHGTCSVDWDARENPKPTDLASTGGARLADLVCVADEPKAADTALPVGTLLRSLGDYSHDGEYTGLCTVEAGGTLLYESRNRHEAEEERRSLRCCTPGMWENVHAHHFEVVRLGPATSATGSAEPEAPPSKASATTPLCQHCGTGIYEGLLIRSCPNGHDLTKAAAEPEPHGMTKAMIGSGACKGEMVWQIKDRTGTFQHPTREGAIAAWREAVRK